MAPASTRGPSLGALGRIDDPAVVQQFQQVLSRLAKIEGDLGDLSISSLGNTGEIRVGNFPIQQLRDPRYGQDAVNLRTLIRYVENRLAQVEDASSSGGDTGGATPGGGTPTIPAPNFLPDLEAYAAAHPTELAESCQDVYGPPAWAFLDGFVNYMRSLGGDGERVGWNGKRGVTSDPSEDAISIWYGVMPPINGGNDVFVIDIIAGHCGPSPSVTWNNVSRFGPGAWLATR